MGIQINGQTDTVTSTAAGGKVTVSGADFTGVSAGTTAAPSISPTGDSNTGIFFPSADTIAIAEGGVEALRINSSGNLGIGTTNPTTTLQVNGTTKVETSIGSTQSVWFSTLDSKSLSADNVSLLVQPENAYFHNSSLSSRNYYPVVVSTALTTNNVSNFGTLYGITNVTNVAGTASTARVYGIGSYNLLTRNSTTDVSSFTNNGLVGQFNLVVQGTNVDASVVTGSAINSTNQTIIQKGTATNINGNYQLIAVGDAPNNSANSTSAFNFNALGVAGAQSGTGIGTITNLYSYYANALILPTGRVSNYYGLYLNAPGVFGGTLSNRYSIYSNDTSSPMYHAGSIGIGITNPSSRLHVVASTGAAVIEQSGSTSWVMRHKTINSYNNATAATLFTASPSGNCGLYVEVVVRGSNAVGNQAYKDTLYAFRYQIAGTLQSSNVTSASVTNIAGTHNAGTLAWVNVSSSTPSLTYTQGNNGYILESLDVYVVARDNATISFNTSAVSYG